MQKQAAGDSPEACFCLGFIKRLGPFSRIDVQTYARAEEPERGKLRRRDGEQDRGRNYLFLLFCRCFLSYMTKTVCYNGLWK